jgi:hypothetical protein
MQPPQPSQVWATLTKQEERIVELRLHEEDDNDEIEELSGNEVTRVSHVIRPLLAVHMLVILP